ncbi:MAG: hypothetical protein DMG75_13620 [Acidobacteria bacterium]|nr:MAG: hypothetical protein DMG75_13620 [Acidobacteriota bacterium]
MRRLLVATVFVFSMVLLSGMPARGCGDKLLVLGRAVRFGALTGVRAAKILAYIHRDARGSESLGDPQFQSALQKAGHQLHIVKNSEQLELALHSGKYDLVLADLADASAIESVVQSNPNPPLIVPVLYEPTKAEFAAAEKRYHCALKAQSKSGNYLSVIDKAIEMKLGAEAKLKRDRSKTSGGL